MSEKFTSRWGLLIAALGMAVGTGNIWRFPRILAQNGGGAFLIPWLLFLFLWAIPLLMVESGMGRKTGYGVVGSFGKVMGRRFTWVGCFVGFIPMAITFYYSVVAGWCVKYLLGALNGSLSDVDGPAYWETFQASGWEPIFFHFVAMSLGCVIIYRGVARGIELATKIMLPLLFLLLGAASIRALTLPGALAGLDYMFNPNWADLLNYEVWLQALSQSAWSTGAGWGLLLTYSVYTHNKRDDIVANSMTIGLGNNSASLLAAMVVIPTVFAVLPAIQATEVLRDSGPANTGLSFIWIPQLFGQIPGGQVFLVMFFAALVVAAISSLIAQLELVVRIFIDAGLTRQRAVMLVGGGSFMLGIPSAINLNFFANQDNVWGIGLMLSGFFFALAVRKYGVRRFRADFIETADNEIPAGRWLDFALGVLIPLQFGVMIVWWLWQTATSAEAWWNPFGVFTLGTCLVQWGIVLVVFYLANNAIADRTLGKESEAA